MKFSTLFMTCLSGLVRNPMRAALTVLGIVIGIAAVVAIMEIGEGSKKQVSDQFASMGTNVVTISGASVSTAGVNTGMGGRASLYPNDADALMKECPEFVKAASPVVRASGQVIVGNQNWSPKSIMGGNEHYLSIEGWKVARGNGFNKKQVEEASRVCLIGNTIATELYAGAKNLLTDTTSAESSYEILRPSQIKLKGKTSSEDDFEDVQEAEVRTNTVRANAAVIGTLVHSLMEAMVSSRNIAPLSALAKEIASEYEAESDAYVQLLTKVGTVIQNGGFSQEGEAPQDILSVLLGADEVYCEVPFCRKSGNEIWHGIMDVVYRIGEQWFILDYKTNADAHDLDVKYQEQLAAYVEAFHDLTGHTAKSLIYHIDV